MQWAETLPSFQKILEQTLLYKKECEEKWLKDYEITIQYITEITGLVLDEKFKVYLTHPSQRNGCSKDNHCITWGTTGYFGHYDVIYLWHEILHSFFPTTDVGHCVIQLITDNGLRILLNPEEKKFPLVGHSELMPLMEKIYPKWEEYLQRKDKNIFQFIKELDSL